MLFIAGSIIDVPPSNMHINSDIIMFQQPIDIPAIGLSSKFAHNAKIPVPIAAAIKVSITIFVPCENRI